MSHLVRTLKGTVHRSDCTYASRGKRWVWADENPTIDWSAEYPHLKACGKCSPPSPFLPRLDTLAYYAFATQHEHDTEHHVTTGVTRQRACESTQGLCGIPGLDFLALGAGEDATVCEVCEALVHLHKEEGEKVVMLVGKDEDETRIEPPI